MPEVEFWARRIDAEVGGQAITEAKAMGLNVLKTFKPPLSELEGATISSVGRIAKMFVVNLNGVRPHLGTSGPVLLIHLMQGGRLNVHEKAATRKDRTARVGIGLADGRELRLREFGTRQRAWLKVFASRSELEADEDVTKLGPEAWPPPPIGEFAELIRVAHHLHPLLRNQRVICGIGRSWVDEILWEARLSPFKQGEKLDDEETERLHSALTLLGAAVEHYEAEVPAGQIPDKLPMPLRIHKREGEPCPRCETALAAIHYSDHSTTYCPECQTGGKVMADRRLSRLLK